jgi:molecular chaperone IbpA
MNQLARIDTNALANINRALVGFDRLFDTFEHRFANSVSNNYPPHNIIKVDEDHYAIELAVAGFQKSEITVHVDQNELVIKGEKIKDAEVAVEYIHRGLSSRDFTKNFVMSEYMVVKGALIKDGILRVDLEIQLPESAKPKMIDIIEG